MAEDHGMDRKRGLRWGIAVVPVVPTPDSLEVSVVSQFVQNILHCALCKWHECSLSPGERCLRHGLWQGPLTEEGFRSPARLPHQFHVTIDRARVLRKVVLESIFVGLCTGHMIVAIGTYDDAIVVFGHGRPFKLPA
ncbi:hypothetical protein D3C71_1512800 [compost metagenome]